jgi:UDP-N-acetylglucosamine acyltransferase
MSTIDPTARIEDGAVIGEGTSIGPYCIVGPHVVIGANCKLIAHVIPFGLASGHYAALAGLNTVGMKRRKFTRERLAVVRSFYQRLFHGPGIFAERLNEVRHLAGTDPAIAEILTFIDAGKHRELCLPAKDDKRS